MPHPTSNSHSSLTPATGKAPFSPTTKISRHRGGASSNLNFGLDLGILGSRSSLRRGGVSNPIYYEGNVDSHGNELDEYGNIIDPYAPTPKRNKKNEESESESESESEEECEEEVSDDENVDNVSPKKPAAKKKPAVKKKPAAKKSVGKKSVGKKSVTVKKAGKTIAKQKPAAKNDKKPRQRRGKYEMTTKAVSIVQLLCCQLSVVIVFSMDRSNLASSIFRLRQAEPMSRKQERNQQNIEKGSHWLFMLRSMLHQMK